MRFKLLSVFSLIISQLCSQTSIGGVISSNTTLNLLGSPYTVTSNIVIFPNVTVNIDPGVTIRFNSATELSVRGKLNINGTNTDSVFFTSANSVPNISDWKGVKIENNLGGKVIVNYCKGQYADMLFNVAYNSADTVLYLKNSSFKNNNFVLYSYDPSNFKIIVDSSLFINNSFCSIYSNYLTVRNSKFYNNDKVIHGWSGPTIQVANSYIYGSITYAFNMSGTITNSVLKNNAIGIKLRDDVIVTYDSIINNGKGLEITSINNIPSGNVIHNYLNYNTYSVYHTSNASVNLNYNCWGTSDSSVIETMIYDVYDNVSLGLVTFMPLDCFSSIGINEIGHYNNMFIYPNPFDDELNLKITDGINENVTILVYDILGSTVKELRYENGIESGINKINLGDLSRGLYFLRIKYEKVDVVRKLIRN